MRLVAAVEASAPGPTEAELKAFVRARLADHKVPRRVVILEGLPRTPTGKVDRRRLDRLIEGRS
jgi:acyl-CoA synthetase (AMP-forming)/AMP-acid ligase II